VILRCFVFMNFKFKIKHLSPFIGSEIQGLDLSEPLSPESLKQLRILWLDRKVLVFPDQKLTPQQQINFTQQLGELDKYPFLEGLNGYPLIAEVLKLPDEKINFGGVWHSDTSYLKKPAAGASLLAIEVPDIGGDTIFCNMHRAYEALSEEIKSEIQHLNSINTSAKDQVSKTRFHRLTNSQRKQVPKVFQATHPVVRYHPETGEKILYVNEAHTLHIEGWSQQKSDSLLNELYLHARKPEFQCRVKWSIGTLLLWDNRSTHHYPINDYTGYRRLLHRVSIKGERPV